MYDDGGTTYKKCYNDDTWVQKDKSERRESHFGTATPYVASITVLGIFLLLKSYFWGAAARGYLENTTLVFLSPNTTSDEDEELGGIVVPLLVMRVIPTIVIFCFHWWK